MSIDESINTVNKRRIRTLRLIMFFHTMMLILFIISVIIFLNKGIIVTIFLFIIFASISLVVHYLVRAHFKRYFKNMMVPLSLQEFGDNFHYSPQGLEQEEIEKTKMLGNFNFYKSDDTISGEILGLKFKCADIRCGRFQYAGSDSEYDRVCNGQFYIFTFPKTFTTHTIITEQNINSPLNLESISKEINQFYLKFYLWTNNIDAFNQMATPNFMDKVSKLSNDIPGDIFIGFWENEVHIAINNEINRFEPLLFDKVTNDNINQDIIITQNIKAILNELLQNPFIFK